MTDMRELYDTALFDIAQTLQASSFHFEKVNCIMDASLQQQLFLKPAVITVRMRATQKLRRCMMRILAHNVTPKGMLSRVNQRRVASGMKLADAHVKVFIEGGVEKILDEYRMKFAKILIESGVRDSTAWNLASYTLLRRSETITFLNAVDDMGYAELIAGPGHQ